MFNERLKKKREERGLTQAELARRVNVGRDSYNKYERAGTKPSQETLVLLAKELRTTVDYLLGKDDTDELDYSTTQKTDDIDINEIEFALYGEIRELDDEDKAELLRNARHFRKLRQLRREQETK